MNKRRLLAIVVAAAALAVHAQSAQKISQIIESQELTYKQAAYIALSFAQQAEQSEQDDEQEEQAPERDALSAAVRLNWIQSGAVAQAPIPLGEYCALCVNATGIKGGIMCGLTNNSPRYCFRELKALGLLDNNADPSMKIDGQNALNLFNACVQAAEASK